MKADQMSKVIEAVRSNIQLLQSSRGEATLEGLEEFSDKMLEIFDALYDQEVAKIMKK